MAQRSLKNLEMCLSSTIICQASCNKWCFDLRCVLKSNQPRLQVMWLGCTVNHCSVGEILWSQNCIYRINGKKKCAGLNICSCIRLFNYSFIALRFESKGLRVVQCWNMFNGAKTRRRLQGSWSCQGVSQILRFLPSPSASPLHV